MKYPASLVPVGAFAGKPALPLTRQHIVVGSGKHARILLKSDTVSSVHTLLIQSDGRWYFRDLVSRTHTILNGKSVRESELKNGDTITIGSFVFHFVAPVVTDPPMKVAPAALDITDAEIPVPIDTKTVLIGKRPGCEIRLMEEGVSTAHAVIFECNGHHFIRDLYSRGGTLLNGKKIHQEVLKFGDVVVVGETIIKYIPDESAAFAPAEESSFAPSVAVVEPVKSGGLLDESAMPVIAHDEAMASHEGPLAGAEDLFAPSAPEAEVEAEAVEAEALAEPPAPAEVESIPPPIEPVQNRIESVPAEIPAVRKPAEIRASLPPGLSSLLETVLPAKPLEVTRPSPIVEQSIPLADEAPITETEPVEVEPEAADVVDELPTVAEAKRDLLEPLPIEEDDLVVPLRRRETVEARVEPTEIEPSSIAPEVDDIHAAGDAEIEDEVESASPTSIAPASTDASAEFVEPLTEVGSPAVANQAVDAVQEIDTADEVELSTDVVESKSLDVVSDDVRDNGEVVMVEAKAAGEVDTSKTVEVSPLDVQAFAEAIRRDFAEVDKQSDPVAEVPSIDDEVAAEPQSARVQWTASEAETPLAEPDAPVAEEPREVDVVEVEAPAVADEPAVAEASADEALPVETPVEPLAAIEQSPELKQLAELQARIAQALQDPSSVSRDPIMPPDAPLVSDPASAMSAAARRARLIAEMLDTTEPLEEEAERAAQSLTFDIDESESPAPVEPISDLADAAETVAVPEIESEIDASPELVAATDEVIEPITIEESAESSVAIDDAMTVADASTNIDEPLAIESADAVPLVPLTIDGPIETADLSIDIADTLPADPARGVEAVSIPLADLIAPEAAHAEQLVAPQDESEVDVPSFALPNAVELSELPIFESGHAFELKADAAQAQPAAELELPAAEALDVPLDIEEVEPTLQGSDHEDPAPAARGQDVFDAASIASVDAPVSDAPIEPAMLDHDEVVEAGQVVDEPISAAPLIDADEPVSESADDALVESNPVLGIDLAEAAAASESNELVVDTTEPLVEPMGELLGKTEIELPESVEDEVFAAPVAEVETPAADVDEIQHLEVESAADMAAEPEDASFIDIAPIAPIEPDQYKAGEVIAVATDVNPGDAPVDEIESSTVEVGEPLEHTVDLDVVAESTPAETKTNDEVRIVVEADEEESLEGQSRPLIAAEEHLVEDELAELPPIAAVTPAAESVEAIQVVAETTSAFEEASPIAEAVAAQVDEPAIEEPTQTIEVNIASAEVVAPFEPEASPFAQEAPAEEVAQSGPIVAEGTTEAAKTPTTIEEPADPRLPRPAVINVNVPSMEKLQAEFDDAFAEALAMAEGKSFAGTKPPKVEPAAEIGKTAEAAQPTAEAEVATERPVSIQQSNTPRPSNLIDVKVPSLDKLEAEFKDSFAEALAMAEGKSFAKPKADAPKPTDESTIDATTAAEAPKPVARPQRKLPEFKLDESLLDQAEKMGGMGGSTAPMAPAAFMNLGGIGWIGDETLDDYEILDRKPSKAKRRSRQRRPVGDLPPTPTVAEGHQETDRQMTRPESTPQSTGSPSLTQASSSTVADPEPSRVETAGSQADNLDLDLSSSDQNKVTAADERDTTTDDFAFAKSDDGSTSTLDLDDSLSKDAEFATAEVPADEAKPPVPIVIPPRPNRPRKGEAAVDQAISPSPASPFAAQELPLVDAFSGMPSPELDEVLARLNPHGGAVKDHPAISQDRPLAEGKEVKVPISPFASQIPIAQPSGNVRRVRQRMSKLPLIGGFMALALIATGTFTWLLPVPQIVRGEVKFRNLDNMTELLRRDTQRDVLAKLGDLQSAARSQIEDMDGNGFLDRNHKEQFLEIVSRARFESNNLLVIEVPSNVNQSSADQRRLNAFLNEVVKANKNFNDAVNKMKDELEESQRAYATLSSEIEKKDKRFEALRVLGDTGEADIQLKKLNRELATLTQARKDATRDVDEAEALLKRLETQMLSSGVLMRGRWLRPVPGVILADASGTTPPTQSIDANADLSRLKRERDDVKARLDRLTAARSPEMAAARESFDRSLEAFSKQVEEARAALGDRPEVLEYVQSATRLQTQIREMTDTLVRRQEQQITRLNEFQVQLKEFAASNKEQRINGDPKLKECMDDLSFEERRLNVARESNATEQEITEIERNISFLKSQIAAKQELLSNPKESSIVGDLEKMIQTTRREMAVDRERNEVLLAEVQSAFQSRQPILEALPSEQKQLTQSFTERLAQINLARQRYTDSLAAVSGTDETLIADAKKQLQTLNDAIAAGELRVEADALAQSREMEKRTEIARQVDDARAKVLAARTNRDEIEKKYYAILSSRDAVATKLAEGANARVEKDAVGKEKINLEEQLGRLIARRKELETQLKFAVAVNPQDNRIIEIRNESDPRLKYFGFAMLAIMAVGAGFATMEVRNRIPAPRETDEQASNSGTPLSGTPTVA